MWSMECWVKMPSVSANASNSAVILQLGNPASNEEAQIYVSSTSHINLTMDSYGPTVTGLVASNNVAYHLVATYDGTNLTLYINGASQGSAACTPNITTETSVVLGNDYLSDTGLNGYLQGVAYYNTVLSASRVNAHYMAGLTNSLYATTVGADLPLRYYRLDESSGTTAHDLGSQAQNGTLNGGITLSQPSLLMTDSDTSMLFDGSTGYISAAKTGLFGVGKQSLLSAG